MSPPPPPPPYPSLATRATGCATSRRWLSATSSPWAVASTGVAGTRRAVSRSQWGGGVGWGVVGGGRVPCNSVRRLCPLFGTLPRHCTSMLYLHSTCYSAPAHPPTHPPHLFCQLHHHRRQPLLRLICALAIRGAAQAGPHRQRQALRSLLAAGWAGVPRAAAWHICGGGPPADGSTPCSVSRSRALTMTVPLARAWAHRWDPLTTAAAASKPPRIGMVVSRCSAVAASGGVQEYTLIKMRVLELKGKLVALEGAMGSLRCPVSPSRRTR